MGAIEFKGPCRTESTMEVEITGDLVAPTSIKEFHYNKWITFHNLNDISLYGRSNLDGQGEVEAWSQLSCKKASKCDKLITVSKYFAAYDTYVNIWCISYMNVF